MTSPNPYAPVVADEQPGSAQPARQLPKYSVVFAYAVTFTCGYLVGTDVGIFWLSGGSSFGVLILFEQSLGVQLEHLATCLGASLLIGGATHFVWPYRSVRGTICRGLLAGYTFAFLMYAGIWLSFALARLGFAYNNLLSPESLWARYAIFAVLAVIQDIVLLRVAMVVSTAKRRMTFVR